MSLGHNFVALKATAVQGATITARVVGGVNPEITLDSDGICVFQLGENATAIEYKASKGGVVETTTISLALLNKNAE